MEQQMQMQSGLMEHAAVKDSEQPVIVITGASRGIGAACALQLAHECASAGVLLVLCASRLESLHSIKQECEKKGATVKLLAADLAQECEVLELVAAVEQMGPVKALIHSAGLWLETSVLSADAKVQQQWDKAMQVNLMAPMHITNALVSKMGAASSVVFIGSTASERTYAGGTNYCASKFGLLGYAGALFEDVRHLGIKVCSILPGVVDTDMHKEDAHLDPKKMIQAQDIAVLVQQVLECAPTVCPTKIVMQPQYNPKK